MDETVKAWAAGIFDGEGSALIEERVGGYYQIFVAVVNMDKRILEPFQWYWHGIIHGKLDTLWFEGQDAVNFLTDILPYLIGKKEQCMVVRDAIIALEAEKLNGIRGASKVVAPYHKQLKSIFIPTKGKMGPNKQGISP